MEISDKTEAQSTIYDLNGMVLKGRMLQVSEARPRSEGRRGRGRRGADRRFS